MHKANYSCKKIFSYNLPFSHKTSVSDKQTTHCAKDALQL